LVPAHHSGTIIDREHRSTCLTAPNFSRLNGSMFVSIYSHYRFPTAWRVPALAVALIATFAAQHVVAQGTHLWTQSRIDEFEKGTPQGVSVNSDGHLREGPGLTELLTTPSTYVWSVAAGKNGETYLGTGSPATVLRVGKDGKAFTLFETKDLSVQVVRLGPDGALYAATLPSGKVYRLKSDATAKQDDTTATLVFDLGQLDGEKPAESHPPAETHPKDKSGDSKQDGDKAEGKSHYIWDLTFDAAGRLYIATGGPGMVYRVDPTKADAKPEAFFKSDEQHIRCLTWDTKGNLIAGSDGSGLVYRIDPQGKGYVLFEAPRREITSVAVGANGTVYAASVGDKSHNPLPPLPVQGQAQVTITIVQPGSLQAANTSASVPEGSEIYALTPTDDPRPQAPRRVWAGKDEIVYALAARKDGIIALTGNRGHIFRITEDGSYADIAHLDAQQGLSLAVSSAGDSGSILIGTGNTGKLVQLGAIEKHEYASDVLDAGALARFGRIEVEPGSSGFELLTRTGNVEQPVRGHGDWGWSDWQPLKDRAVTSPAGRFFEWKAVLHPGGTLGGVGVNYLPVNSAPVVDELMVSPGARINVQAMSQVQPGGMPQSITLSFPSSGQNAMSFDGTASQPLQAFKDRTAITVRWAAHDDNGDDLSFSLYLRGDGESVWRLLKDQVTDKAYSFDAALIPDGGYQIKVVASDAPSHTPSEALTGDKISERFEVDTTPPVVTGLKATAEASSRVTFEAEDAFSPIAHAEYSLDAGPWQFVEPVGGLSDSRHEHYELRLPAKALDSKTGEHLITVRVYDRHDNVGVAKTVFNVPAK
jgi:WD40 repeat protein